MTPTTILSLLALLRLRRPEPVLGLHRHLRHRRVGDGRDLPEELHVTRALPIKVGEIVSEREGGL